MGVANATNPSLLSQTLASLLSCPQAVAEKAAELTELGGRHSALTKQYDEAVHRINLAKQVSRCCSNSASHMQDALREEPYVTCMWLLTGCLPSHHGLSSRSCLQARERAQSEVQRKEEEVVALEVGLRAPAAVCRCCCRRRLLQGIDTARRTGARPNTAGRGSSWEGFMPLLAPPASA
jgi:hypothetical protein